MRLLSIQLEPFRHTTVRIKSAIGKSPDVKGRDE
jgi:hypothetical protein